MTDKEKIDTCHDELCRLIKHWSAEFALTYVHVVGILFIFTVRYITKIGKE